MRPDWIDAFHERMEEFEAKGPRNGGHVAVSIKVRVRSGCFHREHSPRAYRLIDEHLHAVAAKERGFSFVEHESGPELLVYLALATAGITLAKSVIDLVTAIIESRSKGIEQGDSPSDPIELIVRRTSGEKGVEEETVLRIGHTKRLDKAQLRRELRRALADLRDRDSDVS
jgi:hypothetical protein